MFPKCIWLGLLSYALGGASLLAAASPQASPGSQDPAPKPVTAASQPSDGAKPVPQGARPQAQAKPIGKKVYTNENMPAGPESSDGIDFSGINNCNRNCFDQVRQLTHVSPGGNPNWRRDLLSAIDTVRKDAEWQQYLRELYDLHLRFCKLGQEKREEIAKVADPNNVTPRELNVDEKYDVKFQKAQADLEAVYSKQHALQQKFAVNPYSFQFSQLQLGRIQNASCYSRGYSAANASDPDDP